MSTLTQEQREQAVANIIAAGIDNPLLEAGDMRDLFTVYFNEAVIYERLGRMDLLNDLDNEALNDTNGMAEFLNTVANPATGVTVLQAIKATLV